MTYDPDWRPDPRKLTTREDEGLGRPCDLVADPQGIIRAIEVTAEGIVRDASDLLRKTQHSTLAAHPCEVCPAKMERRRSDLAPSLDRR